MKALEPVQKVTAFLTRWQEDGPELLVFQHPLAGIQLPAGTVEFNESLENAVIREVAEETGLEDIEIISYLGVMESNLPNAESIVLMTTKLFNTPAYDSSSTGFVLERGTIVQELERTGKFSAIICDPLDQNQRPPVRKQGVSGFVRTSVLGKRVVRHMFQLTSKVPVADTWQQLADGHQFNLHWVKLQPFPKLNLLHAEWLETFFDQLQIIDSSEEHSSD